MVMSIDDQRAALRESAPQATRRHRILFVGRYAQGPTDIVASLKRALENLGHTVFHLDPSGHRQILDNSAGARGGYGPIYLKIEAIRTVLDRFKPQMLVLCAGGMVLDEMAAAECRDRGIVLLGMTLSDPDVQSSVIDHVGMFDYHTTNAALSLERYEKAGLANTFLMPFGIDRDFALRSVEPAPELRADVICIGHAPGRTDRHEVMGALLSRFNVRVYGSGWPFPGAEPVSGDRLLQAAAEGTFHVNFPATRAGYTNVKCGVFETIAAGGVLCTQVFDEMGRLFEYGSEIVGYNTADDLAETIEQLLKEPERIETIRRNGFRRLVEEHLYEHRWQRLFTSIYEDIRSNSPRIGQRRASEVGAVLEQELAPTRTFLVSGYFGARNRGDDILLEVVTRRIEERLQDANIVVAAIDPNPVETRHGMQAFERANLHLADYWATRSSAVVLGPGGLWNDYSINRAGGTAGIVTGAQVSPAHLVQLPALTVAHGGDFHVFGMGVGPLADNAAKAAVRLSGRLASSVVVRDSTSRELLEQIPRFGAKVEQAPDMVYAADLPTADTTPATENPYVAVNLRSWEFSEVGLEQIRDAVLAVANERGLSIVGVPMQPADELVMTQLFTSGTTPDMFSVMSCDASIGEFARTLAGASAVVSMRLHTSLIAHRLGRPAIGLAYDPKVFEHFVEIDRANFVLGLPVDESKLADLLREVLDEGALGGETIEKLRRLESAAGAAVDRLTDRLNQAPHCQIVPGMIYQEVRPARRSQFGWKEHEILDVSSGTVSSGNLDAVDRTVEFERTLDKHGLSLNLAASAPRKGDFVSWRLSVPAEDGKAVRVELLIRNMYRETWSRRGRIAYEVLVDGEPLFRHDVAAWKPRNSVWIGKRPDRDHIEVEVRVVALRDCEDWSWGRVAKVIIEGIRAQQWSGSKVAWGASSPAAVRLSADATTTVRRTLPRRLIRRLRTAVRR